MFKALAIVLLLGIPASASNLLFEVKEEFYFAETNTYTYTASTGPSAYLMIDLPDQYQSLQIVNANYSDEVMAFTRGLESGDSLWVELNGASDGRFNPYPNLNGKSISYYEVEVPYQWGDDEGGEDWGVLLRGYSGNVPEPSSCFLFSLIAPMLVFHRHR